MKNFQKSKHKNLKIRCHLPNLKRKLIFFSILLLSLLTNRLNAQGVDVIFMMDNSASIINSEWDSMTATTNDLIDEVLGCSPNNRIAVVHYGSQEISYDNYINRIYIESDFTNDLITAKNFERRTNLMTLLQNHLP